MGKLSTTRLAFLAVAVAAAFPVLAQAADAATVDQGTLEKGFSQSTGGNSIFEDTNVALKSSNCRHFFGYERQNLLEGRD